MEQFTIAFDSILRAERVGTFDLVGQSYGGMLAQAYLVHRITDVHRLILSQVPARRITVEPGSRWRSSSLRLAASCRRGR